MEDQDDIEALKAFLLEMLAQTEEPVVTADVGDLQNAFEEWKKRKTLK
jgi:hypothetical protein